MPMFKRMHNDMHMCMPCTGDSPESRERAGTESKRKGKGRSQRPRLPVDWTRPALPSLTLPTTTHIAGHSGHSGAAEVDAFRPPPIPCALHPPAVHPQPPAPTDVRPSGNSMEPVLVSRHRGGFAYNPSWSHLAGDNDDHSDGLGRGGGSSSGSGLRSDASLQEPPRGYWVASSAHADDDDGQDAHCEYARAENESSEQGSAEMGALPTGSEVDHAAENAGARLTPRTGYAYAVSPHPQRGCGTPRRSTGP